MKYILVCNKRLSCLGIVGVRLALTKTFLEETADKFYGALEQALVSNNGGDGYLVGDEVSHASGGCRGKPCVW